MKKKLLFLLTILLVIITTGAVMGYSKYNTERITALKKQNIDDTNNKLQITEDKVELSKEDIINKATEYQIEIEKDKQKYDITKYNVKNIESKVTLQKNGSKDRIEAVVDNGKSVININANTGDLLCYKLKDADPEPVTKNEDEINNIAHNIFAVLGIHADYEIYYLEKFDDEIWRAGFAKKYGNDYNPGQTVRFSFSPESKEIITLNINDIPFDDNIINISQNEAYEIAKEYMNKFNATSMECDLKIIQPNYFWDKNGNKYAKVDSMRRTYVFTCNNESKNIIYVDATTGEITGGDMILGGGQ